MMNKMADVVETAELPMVEEVVVMDDTPPDSMVIVEEPKKEEEKEFDPKTNKDLKKFLAYLDKHISKIPQHSGQTTSGCERGIAHLERGDKMISHMVAEDTDGFLDDVAVEQRRKQMRQMKRQLKKRLDELNEAYDADDAKYAAGLNGQMTKEGQDVKYPEAQEVGAPELKYEEAKVEYICDQCNKKLATKDALEQHKIAIHGKQGSACGCDVKIAEDVCPKCNIKLWKAAEGTYECIACEEVFERPIKKEATTPRIQLVMDPFQRAITGIIVNAVVSQGKQVETVYDELKKEYKFSNRDELAIQQILLDMGYNTARNFVGMPHEKSIEFATNYSA